MQRLQFKIQGSAKQPYIVTFEAEHFQHGEVDFQAFCTCPAGQNGKACKHRKALLHGEFDKIVSGNEDDLALLKMLLEGSDVQKALDLLDKIEGDPTSTKRSKRQASQVLRDSMYNPKIKIPDIDQTKPRTICQCNGEELEIEYNTPSRILEKRVIEVQSFIQYKTDAGTQRIRIESSTDKGHRSFLTHRIISVKNLQTNQTYITPEDAFTQIIKDNNGQQPDEWPFEQLRTQNIALTFENDFVQGWFFGVHSAFKAALDIKYEDIQNKGKPRHKLMTMGLPPAFSFAQGDSFYAPQIKLEKWEDSLKKLSHIIQVKKATPDTISKRKITPGTVEYDLWTVKNGQLSDKRTLTISQKDFADILKHGP